MKTSNDFNKEELARYYEDYERCRCGKQATDWHHAIPRAREYTNSLLNASPVCRECHSHHGKLLHEYKEEISRNAKRLHKKGYKLNENDLKFIVEYDLIELLSEIIILNIFK